MLLKKNNFTFVTVLGFTAAMVFGIGAFPLPNASAQPVVGIPGQGLNSDGTDVFELDRNAVDDGAGKDDDWQNMLDTTPASNGDFSVVTTTECSGSGCNPAWPGVLVDPPGTSIFVQGSKDIDDITDWTCRDQGAPDKDELTDAYAVAYDVNGDLVLYFGADRYDNSGTAVMGFWLLQTDIAQQGDNALTCKPAGDGKFRDSAGDLVTHTDGDLLIVAQFTQGGAIGDMAIYEWVSAGTGSDGTLDQLFFGSAADCYGAGPGDICGTINQGDTASPWPYTPKSGVPETFPQFSFLEGGVNLTHVFSELGGEVPCFSSFLAETRSAVSASASQKDFVLGSFNVCGIDVTKVCATNTPNFDADPITFTYDVGGCYDNTGFGTVTNLGLTDSPAFDSSTLHLYAVDSFPDADCRDFSAIETAAASGTEVTDPSTYLLQPGGRLLWLAQFTDTSNGLSDTVTATAAGTLGAPIDDAKDTALCPKRTFSANISVSKTCDAGLEEGTIVVDSTELPGLFVSVGIGGTVTNLGQIKLDNVTVTDSEAGDLITGGVLSRSGVTGDSQDYTSTYYPSVLPASDPTITFSDTVTATGDVPIVLVSEPYEENCAPVDTDGDGISDVVRCSAVASAECAICDPGEVCSP